MDARLQTLVSDFENGFLTRRGLLAKAAALGVGAAALAGVGEAAAGTVGVRPRKWRRGHGWGWVWGASDQLGSLNELSPALARKALELADKGRVYDLGMTYDRRSFKWPGHSPGEIMTFRTPAGEAQQRDLPFQWDAGNTLRTTFTSHALFISDNVATQLDTYAHIAEGDPPHTYNGFKIGDILGDWGFSKLGAETVPPVVAPGTLIDVAGYLGKETLPKGFAIGPQLLRETLAAQKVDIDPLDVVLIRTGTGGVWLRGDGVGADHAALAEPDTAGLSLSGARWLVEQKGALMVGSDTSGLEVNPATEHLPEGTSFVPVHIYLLVRQGVHILEFVNLERLAADHTYKFCFTLASNKIKGTAAGTILRPLALA